MRIRHFGATHVGDAEWVEQVAEDQHAQQFENEPPNEGGRVRRRPPKDTDDEATGPAA